MAFSSGDARDHGIAEINIIPLCDVLLVLLIIFMVTAPVMSHQIDLVLPQPSPPDIERPEPPEPIRLRIYAAGQAYWNDVAVDKAGLQARMRAEAAAAPDAQPMLQIDANGDCDYQAVARVLALAKNARLAKVGFLRRG